jgi:3-oxoacyl-[acyl-carrier-protein] synthase-3
MMSNTPKAQRIHMSKMIPVVAGIGAYLPPKIVPNSYFEQTLDTNDAWIVERTGIRQRHFAEDGVLTSDLAMEAGKRAIENAGLTADDIDMVLVATTTPDETMPATATRVQQKLGIKKGGAFDVNAACSGFVYGLMVANGLIRVGSAKNILLIGAETYSRIMNWEDRGTCLLFGDGAGAVVLQAMDEKKAAGRGIYYVKAEADGRYADILNTTGGVSKTRDSGVLTMQGKEVFRHAVSKMTDSVQDAMKIMGWSAADLDLLVPHQANIRILQGVAQKLGLGDEKLVITVADHANTSAASIPLALQRAVQDKRLIKQKKLVLTALGAGLTWGACAIVW